MEKFVPYEKLSKKKQRELNAMKRGSWGGFNPITRKPANPKAYNRRTAQRWKDDSDFVPFFCNLNRCRNLNPQHERGWDLHRFFIEKSMFF